MGRYHTTTQTFLFEKINLNDIAKRSNQLQKHQILMSRGTPSSSLGTPPPGLNTQGWRLSGAQQCWIIAHCDTTLLWVLTTAWSVFKVLAYFGICVVIREGGNGIKAQRSVLKKEMANTPTPLQQCQFWCAFGNWCHILWIYRKLLKAYF